MLVKMKKSASISLAGSGGDRIGRVVQAGDVVDIEDKLARNWVDTGLAEIVEAEKRK